MEKNEVFQSHIPDPTKLEIIRNQFLDSRKYLVALGEKIRQDILLVLLDAGTQGINVNEIASKINLSRPAISHHLKILKEADIIDTRREGTSNYYFISLRPAFDKLKMLMENIEDIMQDKTL